MTRQAVLLSLLLIEREERAARLGIVRLHLQCLDDPTILGNVSVRPADVVACQNNLENTYIIRLFAQFEASLRDVWAAAFGRPTRPATSDLLDGSAAHQTIRHIDLVRAHEVRKYRNAIVHGGDATRVTFAQACRRLCVFFSWMPPRW